MPLEAALAQTGPEEGYDSSSGTWDSAGGAPPPASGDGSPSRAVDFEAELDEDTTSDDESEDGGYTPEDDEEASNDALDSEAAGTAGNLNLERPAQMPIIAPNTLLQADGEEADGAEAETAAARAGVTEPEAPRSFAQRLGNWFTGRNAVGLGAETGRSPSGDISRIEEPLGPQPILTLHGYFRTRGEIYRHFDLNRPPIPGAANNVPFSRFRPVEDGVSPIGGCGSEPELDPSVASPCGGNALRFANMRFRIEPTLTINEHIKVHMTIDALDNVVLGSNPDATIFSRSGGDITRAEVPRIPSEFATTSAVSPSAGVNSDRDALRVRRAWAQVGDRDIGELRFGRMPWHWGLGVFANAGNEFDDDFGSDVDRVLGMVHLFGFTLAASYDFAARGVTRYALNDPDYFQLDAGEKDDVNQFMFAVARRVDAQAQEKRLASGGVVVNGGLQFVRRSQFLSATGVRSAFVSDELAGSQLVRRNAWEIVPDAWFQLLWKSFRFETEAILSYGKIENIGITDFSEDNLTMLRFGFAAETELRLLDDKLGIYFDTGFATGDADTDGLSTQENLWQQRTDDRRISTFAFHRNYRIDLILWRNILGHVAGAYYFRPGVSYDFIRTPFGRRAGGRFDLIYSRAAERVQTYGADPNLGVELDVSLYFMGEGGPNVHDGFFSMVQYGVLFPLAGMGFPSNNGIDVFPEGNPGLAIAQTARLLLGVRF